MGACGRGLSGLLLLSLKGKSLWVSWVWELLGVSWRLWVGKGFRNWKVWCTSIAFEGESGEEYKGV